MSDTIIRHALSAIDAAAVETDPFPHVLVDGLFPDDFFHDLLARFPGREHFRKVIYPGTGHGRQAEHFHDYGFACKRLADHPGFSEVRAFFASDKFSRALLDKFSRELPDGTTPIPQEKHQYFEKGASEFTSVFDLQVDLPGYEIPPHADIPAKIVTYQFFLTEGESLRDFGTVFCKPRNGRTTTNRSRVARGTGRAIEGVARILRLRHRRVFQRLEQTRFGLRIGLGNTTNWLPWELFDVVKIAPALPNHFMAFAPNERCYHAVRLNIPSDAPVQERRVIRGFIRTGKDTQNFIAPKE